MCECRPLVTIRGGRSESVGISDPVTVRLFAAIDPPVHAVAHLDHAVGARDGRLRWTPVDQLHVTTAFFGEVPDDRVLELSERLGRVAGRTAPFELRIAGFGGFPSGRRARTVFARLTGDTDALTRLADRCAAAGRRCGIAMEARRFHAHLTIARTRGHDVSEIGRAHV